ncbi:hypothetical protein AC244_32475 [Ensifer adhaerens]|uniref:Uncharacterized protein n=1 Tax=Ensifer adhaerens TaxID=106592 RepID=A0A0L8BE81_ENSAD|nr:hypothetical protein AC244_32475 [Ensifer adhaerens]
MVDYYIHFQVCQLSHFRQVITYRKRVAGADIHYRQTWEPRRQLQQTDIGSNHIINVQKVSLRLKIPHVKLRLAQTQFRLNNLRSKTWQHKSAILTRTRMIERPSNNKPIFWC